MAEQTFMPLAAIGILMLVACSAVYPALANTFERSPQNFSLYEGWDADHSGYIDKKEFNTYSYVIIDNDMDGKINAAEWIDNTVQWYVPYDLDFGEFDEYDRDNSGYLEESEYAFALKDTGLYAYWDYDNNGYVSASEYGEAVHVYIDSGNH